jgi:hypothetical protein
MRAIGETSWTCAHATWPPESGVRVLAAEVPTPHALAFTGGETTLEGLGAVRNSRLRRSWRAGQPYR